MKTPDHIIWKFAKENGFTIVSADLDFVHLSNRFGPPPKIIRLDRMNYATDVAAALIRRNALVISELTASERAVLILRRS